MKARLKATFQRRRDRGYDAYRLVRLSGCVEIGPIGKPPIRVGDYVDGKFIETYTNDALWDVTIIAS
jgi:hypothetical protein